MEDNKPEKKHTFLSIVNIIAAIFSLLMPIVYLTWFAAGIDKSVSLIKQHDEDSKDRINDLKTQMDKINDLQDDHLKSQDDEMNHLGSKIDMIYEKLLTRK